MRPIDDDFRPFTFDASNSTFYGGSKNMRYSFTITQMRRHYGNVKFEFGCTENTFNKIKYMIEDELRSSPAVDLVPSNDVITSMWTPCSIQIKKVIFNNPATIIIWSDGTKTVVKVQNGEEYDPEKGMALCCAKKLLGNKSNFNNEFKKWLPKEDQNDK